MKQLFIGLLLLQMGGAYAFFENQKVCSHPIAVNDMELLCNNQGKRIVHSDISQRRIDLPSLVRVITPLELGFPRNGTAFYDQDSSYKISTISDEPLGYTQSYYVENASLDWGYVNLNVYYDLNGKVIAATMSSDYDSDGGD